MRAAFALLFPLILCALVGWTIVLPATEAIGHISKALAVALPR